MELNNCALNTIQYAGDDIICYKGTTLSIYCDIDNNGEKYTIPSGASAVFGVKKRPEDNTTVINATMTLNTSKNRFELALTPEQTAALAVGRYVHGVLYKEGDDIFPIVPTQTFHVMPTVPSFEE